MMESNVHVRRMQRVAGLRLGKAVGSSSVTMLLLIGATQVTATDVSASIPIASPIGASMPSHAISETFTVSNPTTPAYAGDAGDPDIVETGGTYFAFTTGTPLGNHIQALVDTSGSLESGWTSYTGETYGSTALPTTPAWETANTQTSPGVFHYDNQWIMYYDAAQAGHAGDTGYDCLSVATAATIAPSDPVFTDSSSAPLICQMNYGGAIDPSPYVDPATGKAWLVWKSNDGGSSQPANIWSEELNARGTGFAADSSPTQIFTNNTVAFPWESTVEDPSVLVVGGEYYLLFSGGIYTSSGYAEGYAVCASPSSPCVQTNANPLVSSSGSAAGPGGGSWFQDAQGNYWLDYAAWPTGCTSYTCGGVRRLFVAQVTFASPVVGMASTPNGNGYWLAKADGGVSAHGSAISYGSMAGQPLNSPIAHIVTTPDGQGYWLVAGDGGTFAFGDAGFYGSMGGQTLNAPVVDLAPTADGKGYWLVGSDGGIFAFGDAAFHGSMGGLPLNKPVVGIAATPNGGGYWEVATDGGIFAFGNAPFYGSTGSLSLNEPVNGMAVTADGQGYWFVASDGGIFAFGDAGFHGSMGGSPLNKPIVGMAADRATGGYWLVGSDGGIFSFGAPFFGSN